MFTSMILNKNNNLSFFRQTLFVYGTKINSFKLNHKPQATKRFFRNIEADMDML